MKNYHYFGLQTSIWIVAALCAKTQIGSIGFFVIATLFLIAQIFAAKNNI